MKIGAVYQSYQTDLKQQLEDATKQNKDNQFIQTKKDLISSDIAALSSSTEANLLSKVGDINREIASLSSSTKDINLLKEVKDKLEKEIEEIKKKLEQEQESKDKLEKEKESFAPTEDVFKLKEDTSKNKVSPL